MQRPVLAVDYIEDERLMMPLMKMISERGVRWSAIETDTANIPARAAAGDSGNIQPTTVQSQGFIGKRVNKLLVCKSLVNSATTLNGNQQVGYGNAGSVSLLQQSTQYRLNGKSVFPGFNGVTKPNERLGILTDEYGSQSCFPGSNQYRWDNANVLMGASGLDADGITSGKGFAGSLSYDCVRIGARVADLSIQIRRKFTGNVWADGVPNSATNEALNLNLYAEVDKQLVVRRDGSYMIQYV